MQKNSVMIIDDDRECCEETAEMLRDAGYETHTASNENDALRAIEEREPDIILLDVRMEGGGMNLARRIKTSDGISNIPIIIISGSLDKDTADVFIEQTGVDQILEKPVNPLDIIASLETHLG